MHGFPKLPLARGLGMTALLAAFLLPAAALAQSKSPPPKQPPASGSPTGNSGVPLTQGSGLVHLGDDAPNFKLLELNGRTMSFHEWRGHRAAVLLFADRTKEFPEAFQNMAANLEKIEVRTVGVCRSSGAIPASVPAEGGGAVILRDRWGDLAGQFGMVDVLSGDAVPGVVILDPYGKVRYLSAGAIPSLDIVQGIVNGVLEQAKQETY